MRRRILWLMALLAVVLLGGYVWLSVTSERIGPKAFSRIAEGLSEEEVCALLGPPGYYATRETPRYFTSVGGIGHRRLRWEAWYSNSCCIHVGFDPQGKVSDKWLKKHEEKTIADRLRRWLGLE